MNDLRKKPLRNRARDWLYTKVGGSLGNAAWVPASSVEEQRMRFRVSEQSYWVSADSGTPLYETIAELVDMDAYQLSKVAWPRDRTFTVVDIGANIGVASLLFARYPGAKVLAFEPLPANLQKLQGNLDLNGITNVQAIGAAVSAKRGSALFQVNPASNVGGHLDADAGNMHTTITVPTLAWEDIRSLAGDWPIFLVKMDCEGGEYDILNAIPEADLRRIPYLTMEVHDVDRHHRLPWVVDKLQRMGFTLSYQPDMFQRPNLHHLLAARAHPLS